MLYFTPPNLWDETVIKIERINTFGDLKGPDIDKELGISYPPLPQGLEVGSLLYFLENLHRAGGTEAHQILGQCRANELKIGFLHFMRAECPGFLKKGTRLSSDTKPLGMLLTSLYELCSQIAPYIPVEEKALGVDSARWFHNCVKDIALAGGWLMLMLWLYPPANEIERAKREEIKGYTHQEIRYVKTLHTRIKQLEAPPHSKDRNRGYLATLLAVATAVAQKNTRIQKQYLNTLVKAANTYADACGSNKYLKHKIDPRGKVIQIQGRGRGYGQGRKTLTLETTK